MAKENFSGKIIQPDWNRKEQEEFVKNRCLECCYPCDQDDKNHCDPESGAAK